jgi:dTMP kinase
MATLQGHPAYRMGERYGEHPDDDQYQGKLIIVEGIDGSGKSTQIDLLQKWLRSRNLVTVYTEWNSSPIVKRTTKQAKVKELLTPMSFSLIHAADFASRVHAQILPALRAGAIVLADRYVYTAFARDSVRGVNRDWVRRIYSFAVKPSIGLYFRVPLEVSIERLSAGRAELKYYEAGQDMGFSNDREESFRVFQSRLLDEYEGMTEEYGLMTIDATLPISVQQQQVRRYVEPLIEDAMEAGGQTVPEALGSAGLSGRYITEPPRRRLTEQDVLRQGLGQG